jgi:hypothetical protein
MYELSIWISHPDNGADDCNSGVEFSSYEEARKGLDNLNGTFKPRAWAGCRWAMISGPHGAETFRLPEAFQRAADQLSRADRDDRREAAQLAGMAGGCSAYNRAMGW